MIAKQDYHARVMEYDSWGREIKKSYLDVDQQLMTNVKEGCTVIIKHYQDSSDIPTILLCLDDKEQKVNPVKY